MKIITPETDLPKFGMCAGVSYMASDTTAGTALVMGPCHIENAEPPDFDYASIPYGGPMIIVREGGLGDLIFLTPLLAAIKIDRPDIRIFVCTWPRYFCALAHDVYIEGMLSYPLSVETRSQAGAVLWLEGFIERNPLARTEHPVDALSRLAGVPIHDKAFRYPMPIEERAAALARFPRTGPKRVGVQVGASTPVRSYPVELLSEVVETLKDYYEVVLFAEPGTVAVKSEPGLINLAECDPPVNFREACAVLATCDAALVPDSSLCHVAAALGIPTLALFAAFPSETRVKYSQSVRVLDVTGGCAPCCYHGNGIDRFPEGMPCASTKRCEAIATISPFQVVEEMHRILTPGEVSG